MNTTFKTRQQTEEAIEEQKAALLVGNLSDKTKEETEKSIAKLEKELSSFEE